jgi:hypothetical protein
MHRNIRVCCHKAAQNGKIRPFADDGNGKTSGRLLVLRRNTVLPTYIHSLGS